MLTQLDLNLASMPKCQPLSRKSTPLWPKFTAMDRGKCGKDRRWVRIGEKTTRIVQKTVSLLKKMDDKCVLFKKCFCYISTDLNQFCFAYF